MSIREISSPACSEAPVRLIALGASNLTLGMPYWIPTARGRWGSEPELWVALGHGRSYGMASSLFGRTLPGILPSGLWRALGKTPERPRESTYGLITDVGNDLLYGATPKETLAWVEGCLDYLALYAATLTITDLPLTRVRRLTPHGFALMRRLMFPGSDVELNQALEYAAELCAGLEHLAAERGCRLVRLRPEWYGFDPIHIRRSLRGKAWREILPGEPPEARHACPPVQAMRLQERLGLLRLPPERRIRRGAEQHTPQHGTPLAGGGRIWLF